MNLDPNDTFRHSRAGKHAAAARDGRHDAATAPTVTLKTPAEQAKEIILALNQIRAQCAGDNWVTLEIPRKLWSDIRAAAAALEGK